MMKSILEEIKGRMKLRHAAALLAVVFVVIVATISIASTKSDKNVADLASGVSLVPSLAPKVSSLPSVYPTATEATLETLHTTDPVIPLATSAPFHDKDSPTMSATTTEPSRDSSEFPIAVGQDDMMNSGSPSFVPTIQPAGSVAATTQLLPTTAPSSILEPPVDLDAGLSSSFPSVTPSEASVTDQTESADREIGRHVLPNYVPGNLIKNENGLLLSEGLSSRLLAVSGQQVRYRNKKSNDVFHSLPDMGATFVDSRDWNLGGWIYVSNAEVKKPRGYGGVGALTFDSEGFVVDYRMVLRNTTQNCSGGKTPWGSWISCEEFRDGRIWQVDPMGQRPSKPITLGSDRGLFESFAVDVRYPHYFVTEDHLFGPLRRFSPDNVDTEDPWEELHGPGETVFLLLLPDSERGGSFSWTDDILEARANANAFYPNAEGLDIHESNLFFVSKLLKSLFILDLDSLSYTNHTTRSGVFNGQPDQLQRLLVNGEAVDDLLYYTEDGGKHAGIHARDGSGKFFTILESPVYSDETTGLAFSPSNMHMYIAYQDNGTLFEITRDDGLPFHAKSLNVKYHQAN